MSDDAPFLLDVTRLIWRRWKGRYPTGIDRVCLAYLARFGGRAQAVINHDRFRGILGKQASQDLFGLLENPESGFRLSLGAGVLKHMRSFNGKGLGRPYLNVGHTGLNLPTFRRWVGSTDLRPIYLVHDLIPITNPQLCRPGESEKHRERMRTVLLTGAGVIGNSQFTLDALSDFGRAERLPSVPSVAAWLGIDPISSRVSARAPDRPTFVTIGTIEGRKNHLLLLKVWSRLIDRLGSQAPRLLIIGQRGWQAEPVFKLLDNSEQLRGHVIEINRCSDDELAQHLITARALLFPSFVEGYGLPLIEAFGRGVPVIASDLPVFREIASEIPTYLSPLDEAGWEAAILDFARPDSATRAAQVNRIESFREPEWNSHFEIVEQWLGSLD